jgi:excisionase family DNA binding protein
MTMKRNGARSSVEGHETDWFSPRQAAVYLHVGVDIIYESCAGRGLRHVKLGHSTIRIRRDWLESWMEAQARG